MFRSLMFLAILLTFLFWADVTNGQRHGNYRNRSNHARSAACDSMDIPCDAQDTMAIPMASHERRCSCADCQQCQQKNQHIHIQLTTEQIEKLLQAQNATRSAAVSPQAQTGQFVAPPATGVIAEESSSIGWRGPVLRFPEFKIGLPSLELPSRYRVRHPRRMRVDAADAAYVDARPARQIAAQQVSAVVPSQQFVQVPMQQQAVVQPRAACVNPNTEAAIKRIEQMTADLAEKERLLEEKLRQYNRLIQQATSAPANGCDSGGCDAAGYDATSSTNYYRQSAPIATPAEPTQISSIRVDPDLANEVDFIPQIRFSQTEGQKK